ncbi:hypothetical protein DFP72DRAFT_191911 [Ephemerocybe angulata]|uniref:Uncharacterized protein n=1 Tax=Ephemerocybe angulata TaxID=980116 RepID=A0A8H6I3M7_9AGAR|nr:hypothetical protein DFP72DRAFT_191911 [Tulosesus angulatus]
MHSSLPFGPLQNIAAYPFISVCQPLPSPFKLPARGSETSRSTPTVSFAPFASIPVGGTSSLTSSMNTSQSNTTCNRCDHASLGDFSWQRRRRPRSLAGIRSVAVGPTSRFIEDPLPHSSHVARGKDFCCVFIIRGALTCEYSSFGSLGSYIADCTWNLGLGF